MAQPNQPTTKRPTALITGAASGIGLELAKLLARDGYALILVDVNRARLLQASEALERAYHVPVKAIIKDLATESAAPAVYAEVKRLRIVPDVLINDAGFGEWGDFVKLDLTRQIEMMKINMVAMTALLHEFLPDMIKRGSGRVLNVASQAAFYPGPLMAVYFATKAYVLSLSEALAEEVRENNISISTLCPGPTDTHFAEVANLKRSALFHHKVTTAKAVAAKGYRGMQRGRRVILINGRGRLQVWGRRIVPIWVTAKLVAHRQRRLY